MKKYLVTLDLKESCTIEIYASSKEDIMRQIAPFDNMAVDIIEHPTRMINGKELKVEHIEVSDLTVKESA